MNTSYKILMKVLHLIGGGDVGGAKVHVLSLVKELGRHIDVKIVSFRPGIFADDARKMGIDIEVVKTGNILKDIARVIRIIREGGFQLVHSHGAKANMISLVSRIFTRLPAITTVHSDYKLDYMHSIIKSITFGTINAFALRYMDYYIGVSKNFREMLVSRNFKPRKVFVLYNGMDFDSPVKNYSRSGLKSKYSLNLKDDEILVGIAARLYPVKGIDTLIEAAKLVVEDNPKVKFLIGGDGEDREALEKRAAELGITDNVKFLGWLADPYELMSVVDISVLTSISESFPYSVLEGARFKKATISSNVGGIPDLIEHGSNGYLFKPGDYPALAGYILELAGDAKKRDRMGELIFKKASSLFSLESMCRTQLEIYRSILERSPSGRQSAYGYDVIISGYYGFRNIGDDAMLQAIIENLRHYKEDIRIIILSKDPVETEKIYGEDSINRLDLYYIYKIMKRAKLFIYGGGNLIQDNTSTRSLFYYLGTVWLAKRMNLKIMFYANGIGPLNKAANKLITQKIINKVDMITLREKLSLKELSRLGIDGPKTLVTADPALTVAPCPESEADSLLISEGIKPKGFFIGFSVRKWDGYEKYEEIIARAADYMLVKYNLKPLFIPMHHPDDLYMIERVLSKMKGKGYVIRNKYSVPETMGIINKMDMLVGMRLHALIFAASLGKPVIGLAYEPKIEGFLSYINQSSAGDISKLEFEPLKALMDKVWTNREEISSRLAEEVASLKEKAQQNAILALELAASSGHDGSKESTAKAD